MILLPIFMALAVGILLYILRRERQERAAGNAAPRPFYITLTLAAFAVVAVVYAAVYITA